MFLFPYCAKPDSSGFVQTVQLLQTSQQQQVPLASAIQHNYKIAVTTYACILKTT